MSKSTEPFDVERIRQNFPILSRKVHGRPLVYLDNAATTQKPRAVIDALVEYYETFNANIHRGLHALSEEATARYEESRAKTAAFVNAPEPGCIVFTRNATESLNLVANAWGRANLKPGDEVLLSVLEHHSNLVPWQMVAKATGAVLRFLDIDDEGKPKLDDLDAFINRRTKIVSVSQVSNGIGTIVPVREIGVRARAVGALFIVDGAQSVPHMPVDVQALGCDFLAFSGHKMLGPTGVGVLYGRREILEAMDPFLGGGEMIKRVQLEESTWNDVPWKFEAGTPNIGDVIAFSAAIDYLQTLGMDRVREHEMRLTDYAMRKLRDVPNVVIYGPPDVKDRGGVVSFNYGDLHPHDLGTILDHHGVAIRAGHHCTQPLMRRLGVAATARASFYLYNKEDEIDVLLEGIEAARRVFGDAVHT